jgi:hypothetical protein
MNPKATFPKIMQLIDYICQPDLSRLFEVLPHLGDIEVNLCSNKNVHEVQVPHMYRRLGVSNSWNASLPIEVKTCEELCDHADSRVI